MDVTMQSVAPIYRNSTLGVVLTGMGSDGTNGAAGIKAVATSVPLVIGLGCFALNAAFYMYALQSKALKISVAYPVMVGGGFALIAVAARFHPSLAERLTWGQMAGVALVLLGVVLIAFRLDPASA